MAIDLKENVKVKIIAALRIIGVFVVYFLIVVLLAQLLTLLFPSWGSYYYFITTPIIFIYYYIVIKLLGKKEKARTGLAIKGLSCKYFLTGLGLGTACIIIIWFFIFLFGGYSIKMNELNGDTYSAVLNLLVQMLLAGFSEEVLSRGFMAFAGYKGGKLFSAIFISLIFSLMHGAETFNIFSVVSLFLFSIVCFQLTWISGSLWPAIGFHAAWNFIMGGIFGVSISGMKAAGIFISEYSTANYLNGGWHGLEGSFVCTLFLGVVIFCLWRFLIRIKKINHTPFAEWLI